MKQQIILTRQEQDIENTWNMQDLYIDEEGYKQDGKKLNTIIETFISYQGTLDQGSEQLYRVLKLYEEMNCLYEKMYVYATQKYHEDTTNAKYQQMSGEIQITGVSLEQSMSWLEPELLALPEKVLAVYFEENEKLACYKRFVSQITRNRAHILNAEMEAMLSRVGELGQFPSDIYTMFENADVRFPEIQDSDGDIHSLTQETYYSYLESKDRTLRKNAFEALYCVYGQFQNTLAATFYANVKQADFFAKERNYENSLKSALEGSEIPVSVYRELIGTVNKHLPLIHRYMRLRKTLLNLEELHMYDLYVPLVKFPEKKYTFEEAKEIVKCGLSPLGEDYLNLLEEGFTHRWIDIYENVGKHTGAYSWGTYGTHPYVLLNFHGTLNDVFTLAHEMGHALHSYYSNQKQTYLNSGYQIFVAEVASTCNEALLIRDLMEKTQNPEEKKYLINYFLEQFRGTVYRQTMFAEFEMRTHDIVEKGGMFTAEKLNEIYLELNKRYYGEDMIVDSEISYEWARISHFYSPFYVYQYATGFAAAIAISSKIFMGEEGIVEKYKQFLSSGCSDSPIELLKICGIDMSSPQPVEEALNIFEEYISQLENMTS